MPTNITYFALNKHGKEFGFPEVSLQKLGEIVSAGLRAVELTRDAGVKIGHGSDLLGPCHKYQSDEFSLKAEVLGNHGAIKSATMTNAELFEQEDEIGVLAEGYKADLIVVRGKPAGRHWLAGTGKVHTSHWSCGTERSSKTNL